MKEGERLLLQYVIEMALERSLSLLKRAQPLGLHLNITDDRHRGRIVSCICFTTTVGEEGCVLFVVI